MVSSGSSGIEVELGQSSDPGLDPAKRINEDACGSAVTALGHLFVICDGMGGHAGGKQASDIAIRTVLDIVSSSVSGAAGDVLVHAIEEAGRRVYAFGGPPENQQRPGSTLVALLMHDGLVDVAHVGDSRAYAIRGKQIYGLTRDHSMVQELLDGGVISEHEAVGHPDSNKITRALGMTPEVQVERRDEPMDLYEGDVFVLATDGLTDLARNDDILVTVTEYLRTQDVQAVCDELVALANRRGGHDNITVQVIRIAKVGKSGITKVQEPGFGPPRISTTIGDGPQGVSPTVVQSPMLNQPGPAPAPDAMPMHVPPSPTVIDPTLNHDPRPYVSTETAPRTNLLYVIMAMAAVIGLLLAVLFWALIFR